MKYDILIIGAGISGAVLAERYASAGKSVLILEKRSHIAGNCYDYINKAGILVSEYGAHLFHTNIEEVWNYVNQFAEWYPWEHSVQAVVDGKLVPIPVNIDTVNKIFETNIQTSNEMDTWLAENRLDIAEPANGEEAVLSKIGTVLYEKMFKHYTKKQWNKYPVELDASVLNRIPVRNDKDNRYFADVHQALPLGGFTKMFENILASPNITIKLNTDFFDIKNELGSFEKIFYTGPIDRYFDLQDALAEQLEYRSIRFESETLDQEYFQDQSVINYPGAEVDFTRIVEYKHFGNQKSDSTTIVREYTTDVGDPYYPVLNNRNRTIYEKYKAAAEKEKGVYFVGRLANYKYFNMDEAFKNALDLYKNLEN